MTAIVSVLILLDWASQNRAGSRLKLKMGRCGIRIVEE